MPKAEDKGNWKMGDEYPEVGEFVIGTVQSIFKQGAFITLDEYGNKKGMLHLSEISLKWVRNIRDYVREGQKVVLQVLSVNPERGHIDLSLRRVSDAQRKRKLQEVKQRQRADKLLKILADELKVSPDEVDNKIGKKLLKEFDSLYEGLEAIAGDDKIVDRLSLNEKWKSALIDIVKKNIKPPFVYITGYVELRSYEPNGVNIIKESLKKIENYKTDSDFEIEVGYVSPPIYRVKVRSKDYKSAEKLLRNAIEKGINYIEKNSGIGEFHRKIEEVRK